MHHDKKRSRRVPGMPYVIMVRCPNADKAVSTGIHCDIREFSAFTDRATFDCPECGQRHEWSLEDAWLRAAPYAIGGCRSATPDDPHSTSTWNISAEDENAAT
jgi:predicted RNA-binding Zn-ribbon protein involved in translation (DUF1610 family)